MPVNRHYPIKPLFKIPKDLPYTKTEIENELIQCGKSAYLEVLSEGEFKYLSENYPEKRFYYLKDLIPSWWVGYQLERLENSKTYIVLKLALDSGGFVHFIKNNLILQRLRTSTKLIKNHAKVSFIMNMESQIQTVFVLAFSMLLGATGAFLVEYKLGVVRIRHYLMKIEKCKEYIGRIHLESLYTFNGCS